MVGPGYRCHHSLQSGQGTGVTNICTQNIDRWVSVFTQITRVLEMHIRPCYETILDFINRVCNIIPTLQCHHHTPWHHLLLSFNSFPSFSSLLLPALLALASCLLVWVVVMVMVGSWSWNVIIVCVEGIDCILSQLVITCPTFILLHFVSHFIHQHPVYLVHYHPYFIHRIHISLTCNFDSYDWSI